MIGWPTMKIGDLVESGDADLQTGPFGTQLRASDYVDEGTPVVNLRKVGFGEVRAKDVEYLGEAMVQKLSAHVLETGDIVFGRKGAVERHALIKDETSGWVQGSDCLRLRVTGDQVRREFLSYYFRTKSHQHWMEAVCSFGATMSSLNQDIVKRIEFPAPCMDIQKKIVGVLATYDDKIANNQSRIVSLRRFNAELYREWFVRKRFPAHNQTTFVKGVPTDWKVTKLKEVLELCYGKALKASEREGGDIPVYGSGGIVGFHDRALVDTPGIIVGRKGNVGSVYFSDKPFYAIDTVYFVKSQLSNAFLFFLLQSMNFINNDAAVPGLNRNQAYSNQFFLPPAKLIDEFTEIAESTMKNATSLEKQNDRLRHTRDLLLGRLISGKLSLETVSIDYPPSMSRSHLAVNEKELVHA